MYAMIATRYKVKIHAIFLYVLYKGIVLTFPRENGTIKEK